MVKIYARVPEVWNVSAHALKAAWGQHQQAYIDPSNCAAASVSQYRGQPYILTLCSNSALELRMCAHESSLHKVKTYCTGVVLAFLSSECQAHAANRRCADCIDPVTYFQPNKLLQATVTFYVYLGCSGFLSRPEHQVS